MEMRGGWLKTAIYLGAIEAAAGLGSGFGLLLGDPWRRALVVSVPAAAVAWAARGWLPAWLRNRLAARRISRLKWFAGAWLGLAAMWAIERALTPWLADAGLSGIPGLAVCGAAAFALPAAAFALAARAAGAGPWIAGGAAYEAAFFAWQYRAVPALLGERPNTFHFGLSGHTLLQAALWGLGGIFCALLGLAVRGLTGGPGACAGGPTGLS